ncbi:class I mannose-6-phosphate isomerase [Actinoplanes sp. NPDC049265]|uniref:class I mannose-6-phosphate isomerase n=1 Tax=Actinoplanes sp. NPDC049265 TaxID=3363902 RepID=UPI00371998CC
MTQQTTYEPEPIYPPASGLVRRGWDAVRDALPGPGAVLAVDGPMMLDWPALAAALPPGTLTVDMRGATVAWDQVQKRTASAEQLAGDPDFATLAPGTLADLIDELPAVPRQPGRLTVVYGPGAALADHDELWYADLPKRYAEHATTQGHGRNLGRPGDGTGTTQRLFYIDWPLLDRHRDAVAPGIAQWLDLQDPADPRMLAGPDLRATLEELARRPLRTRPTFNTTSWGGHWAQERLGMNTQARNTALGYELIAPESGVLIGTRAEGAVEVPFQLLVASHPEQVLGAAVRPRFGPSFPIRFDYLDTYGGGSLSVHCHPRPENMRTVFGWAYPQHETYYVLVGSPDNVIHLGLRDAADLTEFERRAHAAHHDGEPFEIERYVQQHPATEHQLFLVPAGTPHGSGQGNVVLEISATPYLYSLRFYDWLRRDAEGRQRPVHVGHAFDNLDTGRTGAALRADLIQRPRTIVTGDGWREDLIGALPELFFRVHRLELDAGATAGQETTDRFHVLNVVAGDGVAIRTRLGEHRLSYAETLVVPAAVGRYTVTASGPSGARVVKAFVA